MDVTVGAVGAALNGSILLDFQDKDDEYGILATWLYLSKTSLTRFTTKPVWNALGSNTSFRGKEQRLSTTSMTRKYVHEGVFIWGVCKIKKSGY
jgi:hypothetical protein